MARVALPAGALSVLVQPERWPLAGATLVGAELSSSLQARLWFQTAPRTAESVGALSLAVMLAHP